ncbi:hypothetical protein CK215_25365 [Mesorhizobium sp. WSM3864]|uniref:hypothetical protein n=1 Tax=Mesorhizobium sp. WSM3864 TaxID=2029404 RepID=UPI000BB02BA6|nr:hypothetical protein [Mesorhizobium sp. WSM3864]PBB89778.1 hypothetical protein CK215_25365 [Mesorhizobium sp. WSM3864]
MIAILRNALLAALAVSTLGGSAMAGQQIYECDNTPTNKLWAGRCCGVGDANCLGGESHGHDRGNNGGGDNGRGDKGPK